MKICRECTKEPYSFLTIDATLPARDPLQIRKNLFHSYKMKVTDQIKVLNKRINQNEG